LTYARIVEWATKEAKEGHVPTFRVYAAGKAQEVIRIMNEYTKLRVLTCPPISRINQTHSKYGVHLEYSDLVESDADQASVCVATHAHKIPMPKRLVRAVATGWALGSRSNGSSCFPLSSHADFKQLVEYVRCTGARRIYVYTGYVDLFCEYLSRKLRLPTLPLPALEQTDLRDY
jgi:putative mRNA 3-end processing factor